MLVAGYGFISLALDLDVIPEPDAGPLVGVAMHAASLLVMFFAILGGLAPDAKHGIPVARALVGASLIYLLMPLLGGLSYAMVRGELLALAQFTLRHLASPFVGCATLAALAFLLALPLIRTFTTPR